MAVNTTNSHLEAGRVSGERLSSKILQVAGGTLSVLLVSVILLCLVPSTSAVPASEVRTVAQTSLDNPSMQTVPAEMEARYSKNVMDTVESCVETVRHRLTRTVERTLRPMKEDAVSKLGSLELVFLTLVGALSSFDAEVSVVLLMEMGRSEDFSSRELAAGQDLPWEVLSRAAKFAVFLERSGMFAVPQEFHRDLAQLLSGAERTKSSAAGSLATIPFPDAHQVTSTVYQTEKTPTSEAVKVTSAASQTVVPVPRMTREEAQRQLWEGVKRNGRLRIEEAVLSGADLEEERDDKMTPLTVAAKEGQVKAVRTLLRLGAELEGRVGEWQRTALHWAAAEGHEAVVRELLAAGASVGAENRYRSTPLLLASQNGHLTTARLLVEAGADPNAKNSWGNTPLSLAVSKGHTAVEDYLRSVGATN